MKIAVTYENGEIFQHFGHSAQFKVYDVEYGRIVFSEVVDTNGSGHGALIYNPNAGCDHHDHHHGEGHHCGGHCSGHH